MRFLKKLIPWRVVRVNKRYRNDYVLVHKFSELILDELCFTSDWVHYSKSFAGDQLYRYATCVRKALDDGNSHTVTVTAVDLALWAMVATANWGDLNDRQRS